jgi:hypothetical protein
MAAAPDDFDPFKPEDLDHVLREERSNNEADGWSFVRKDETSEIWMKSDPNTPIKLIKGYLRFPGIPPSDVIEMITNLDVRRRWDTRFVTIEILDEFPMYKLVYWRIRMPFGTYDRDLVQCISHRVEESTGLRYVLYKSTTDDRKPEQPGLVRAQTILSGVLIRPEEGDVNSTRLTLLLQNDPMGWIPKYIVNLFASRAPFEWRDAMATFYHDVYVKEREKN